MTASAVKHSADNTAVDAFLARITSAVPTRYKLVKHGNVEPVYVYCALDTLEYAWITGKSYRIVADPPVDAPIEFALTPSGPKPVAVWMSMVIPERIAQLPHTDGVPSPCCPYTHFFASKNAFRTWSKRLPDEIRPYIRCLPLQKAWQNAQCVLAACETP